MQAASLKEAQKHVLFQHSNADGWVTVAQKDSQSGRFRQYHYRPEELAEHLSEWMGEDIFFSQNSFYRPARRIDTIRQLRSLYVDLDVYNKNIKPEWALQKLELEVFGQSLPNPNMVIFSGRGLVLIWHIEPIPYQVMPLWRAVENYFIRELQDLGSDAKASDPTRIFRIAGTINSKSGTMVTAEYRHTYRYDIHQIQYDYLPELSPKKLQQKKPGRKPKVIWLFNVYTLHLARARDIAKLVEIREGQCKGHRETILFLYRYFTCCYTEDPQKALMDTLSLNEEFTIPLPEREVIKATVSAQKAWEAKSDKKANEAAIAMGYKGAGYRLRNDKIIEWLDITAEEMQHMSTIIDSDEKRRRKRAHDRMMKEKQRRETGVRTQKQFFKEYNKVRKIQVKTKEEAIREVISQDPKATVREIAEKTGIAKSTVGRILKAL